MTEWTVWSTHDNGQLELLMYTDCYTTTMDCAATECTYIRHNNPHLKLPIFSRLRKANPPKNPSNMTPTDCVRYRLNKNESEAPPVVFLARYNETIFFATRSLSDTCQKLQKKYFDLK